MFNFAAIIHLNKAIEINRNGIFDIITQYRAIFSDEDYIGQRIIVTEPPTEKSKLKAVVSEGQRQSWCHSSNSVLSSWLNYRIREFLAVMKLDLNRSIETNSNSSAQRISSPSSYPIDVIVEPCYRFAAALSRIGADFRPQLTVIFSEIFMKKFKRHVIDATVRLVPNKQLLS